MAKTYEEIIGSKRVHELAHFWHNSSETMNEVKKIVLSDFCEKQTFDKDQYDAFKSGVASVLLIFESCLREIEQSQDSPTGDK